MKTVCEMRKMKTDHGKKKNNGKAERRINNLGTTLVELVVSFALLAIFLASATMCISHAVLFYYYERQEIAALSVADLAFSEIKDEIRTMQSSKYNGYVKIRDRNEASKSMDEVSLVSGNYTGSCIEFVTSNIHDAATAVQIDTEGCGADGVFPDESDGLYKGAVMINQDGLYNSNLKNINAGYVTERYYCRYPETEPGGYDDLFMDVYLQDSSASKVDGFNSLAFNTKVVWHALEKIPVASYQDFRVKLMFSVKPEADGDGNLVVKNVDVAVYVLDKDVSEGEIRDEGELESKAVYVKKRSIELQNTVYYRDRNVPTMYSDVVE